MSLKTGEVMNTFGINTDFKEGYIKMSTKGIHLKWSDERKERNKLRKELEKEIKDNALSKFINMSMMSKCETIDNHDAWDDYKRAPWNPNRFRSIRTQVNSIVYDIIFEEENKKEKYKQRKERLSFLDGICKKESEDARQERKKLKSNQ
jgi:hypothetical protein